MERQGRTLEAVDVVDDVERQVRGLEELCNQGALGVVWRDDAEVVREFLVVVPDEVHDGMPLFHILRYGVS